MLGNLIKLGKQLSDGRGEWDHIIDFPNITKEREKNINCFVAELVFDLDSKTIYVSPELIEYEDQHCFKYKNIKIQGGNNKAIYCCVEAGKTEQIRKTFFGTIDGKGKILTQGQFYELINKDYPQLLNVPLISVLSQIFLLKNVFEDNFTIIKESKGKTERVIDEKLFFPSLNLGISNKVVLLFTSVISTSLGINVPTPIANIEGYDAFIHVKFLNKKQKHSKSNCQKKICYANGKISDDVTEVEFTDRYSINKMFVKETKNFASHFDKNNFGINYQVSADNQLYLSRASNYLLANQKKIRIAGIAHCIIPQFLNQTAIDLKYILSGILNKTELLFQTEEIDSIVTAIEYETNEPYWITYLAFESDGNFFKTINEIKDVSKLHFYKLLENVRKIDNYFRNDLRYAVDWQSVMMNYGKPSIFNLSTIYSIVPLRKDKEKKNEVLAIFKLIFENRKVDKNKIFKHFCDLVLCHRYKRYKAFKNIREFEEQYFDFAIRDSVFKYFALITFLKQLNLLNDMEQNETSLIQNEEQPNEYKQKIDQFFKQMGYNADQKAMFHLGRMLNAVAYLQKDKNKTVLEKVNFSGMDRSDILRLRNSLIEKAQQYNKVDKVVFSDANFSEFFNYNSWKMKPEESVFFLLSGYSFGLIKN